MVTISNIKNVKMPDQTSQTNNPSSADLSDGNALDITNNHRPSLSFTDFPFDMFDEVGSRLSLSSLHNLCQSSIGGSGSEVQSRLRGMFRRRLRNLDHVWKFMDVDCVECTFEAMLPYGWNIEEPAASPADSCETHVDQFSMSHGLMKYFRLSPPQEGTTSQQSTLPLSLTPAGLLEDLRRLKLNGLDKNAAEVIAGEFPELLSLSIERKRQDPDDPEVEDTQTRNGQYELSEDVQKSIGKLTRLEVLSLINQNISHLSCPMLQNLSNVEMLVLEGNPRLKSLPERIGEWMPKLNAIIV